MTHQRVLWAFVEREQQIKTVQDAITKRFKLDPKQRVARQPVHELAAQALRTNVNHELITLTRIALERLNVRACVSRGRRYYRGLGTK